MVNKFGGFAMTAPCVSASVTAQDDSYTPVTRQQVLSFRK
jgi:hypothetical protein